MLAAIALVASKCISLISVSHDYPHFVYHKADIGFEQSMIMDQPAATTLASHQAEGVHVPEVILKGYENMKPAPSASSNAGVFDVLVRGTLLLATSNRWSTYVCYY